MTQPDGQEGWGVLKLSIALYPFGAGAVALNLFMAGLLAPLAGWPTLSPVWSVVVGCVLGVPATWAFARHIRALMDRADAMAGRADRTE